MEGAADVICVTHFLDAAYSLSIFSKVTFAPAFPRQPSPDQLAFVCDLACSLSRSSVCLPLLAFLRADWPLAKFFRPPLANQDHPVVPSRSVTRQPNRDPVAAAEKAEKTSPRPNIPGCFGSVTVVSGRGKSACDGCCYRLVRCKQSHAPMTGAGMLLGRGRALTTQRSLEEVGTNDVLTTGPGADTAGDSTVVTSSTYRSSAATPELTTAEAAVNMLSGGVDTPVATAMLSSLPLYSFGFGDFKGDELQFVGGGGCGEKARQSSLVATATPSPSRLPPLTLLPTPHPPSHCRRREFESQADIDISNIPCRVCGGRSSGFHFGALTCEGCKGFFRRTEETASRLVCVGGKDNCSITPRSRNACKACRFRRCLRAGMSKKVIEPSQQGRLDFYASTEPIDYPLRWTDSERFANYQRYCNEGSLERL
ncbi:unnamed protein product [Schistocephalus solidus]|uniref:Nuclear receptor domain-containing protein n=1 Tax=Schistocephalus solidus TaxID=70667 RepID=A0A183T3N6_SCHSO|nr:unnamed protein product [Schistocephalus solidus]